MKIKREKYSLELLGIDLTAPRDCGELVLDIDPKKDTHKVKIIDFRSIKLDNPNKLLSTEPRWSPTDIKYKYLNLCEADTTYFKKEIPTWLDFKETRELRKVAEFVGLTDEGWSKIMKVGEDHYLVQEGLLEYEGNIYMTPVEIIKDKDNGKN